MLLSINKNNQQIQCYVIAALGQACKPILTVLSIEHLPVASGVVAEIQRVLCGLPGLVPQQAQVPVLLTELRIDVLHVEQLVFSRWLKHNDQVLQLYHSIVCVTIPLSFSSNKTRLKLFSIISIGRKSIIFLF